MSEWLKEPVSKTGRLVRVSWVRIPPSPLPPALPAFPVVIRVPVFWGELDAYGHVNNAVFFRWFEQARMEYFVRCGFLESHQRERVGAILHSTSCRFRRPVFHPDSVDIGARVIQIEDDRFTMEYAVHSVGQEQLVAEGSAVVVSYDYRANRKTAVPTPVRAAIQALESATAARLRT